MWLVHLALRRPVTIVVAVLAVALASMLAMKRMRADIFPALGSPTVFVAQPYGGMDPSQMEGFLTYYYEYHFLYITGIEHVESKSIQGVALMKLVFHPDTNMNQALAETVAQVNRARAFMPPGAVPPFIVRFDAGSVPVGQLVFSSPTRSPGEMQDIAINRVRPLFATLPGVSAPPPFGGNQRTIVVRVDPERMRAYEMSPEEVITAVNRASAVLPSGNVRIGDQTYLATTNVTIGGNLQELMDAPVRTGAGAAVYIRDVGVVENGTDIITGYAHVNGRRTVYIPITKRSDASTLDVIRRVREALPRMKAAVPEDVDVRVEFDQSGYVARALRSVINEAMLGALLAGLMVLLFLRDWRSALVVITTIPFSLLGAIVGLWAVGQTINIMTLAGLALAVGVLVDEATVEIENMHTHLSSGESKGAAILNAARKTAGPRLLSMLCILAVFVPSFFMAGVGRQLFVPLSLSVAFAMISSYVLSSTLVPVLAAWLVRHRHEERRSRVRERYRGVLERAVKGRWLIAGAYTVACAALILLLLPRLGTEIFPSVDSGQFQLRLRAPAGTRIERTETMTLRALDLIRQAVGPENVEISTSFIGVQPASYPINTIYLWTSGPQESVLAFALKPSAKLRGEALKEELRARFAKAMPDVRISFEAGDIVSRVMSFGADTPIEVAVQGPSMPANREHAKKVYAELSKIRNLRDLQVAQPLEYPVLQIDVDRDRAGQLGLTAANVARSLVAATSSSRFIDPNYWRDPNSGNAFQIQVEIPQNRMQSIEDVRAVPVGSRGQTLLGDVAEVKPAQAFGLVERYNMQRVVSMTANVHGKTVGEITEDVQKAVKAAGEPPRGVTVAVRGQIPPLEETISGLEIGLLLSAGTIFLLLVANFQSVRLALAVLSTLPAAVLGSILMLLITGTTLNVQSFIGAIMASGIAVANSILLVTFAEMARRDGAEARIAAVEGGSGRLRAVLMTAAAMIAGMIPLALASNETAPLARAVIGGLALATISTLFVLPSVYAILQSRARRSTVSLHPSLLLIVAALGLQAQPVDVTRVESRGASRTVALSGEFAPYQSVDIHARVPGFIEKVLVDRGSAVRQGQLLATLTAPEMDAQLAEAEARASLALSRVKEASARLASVQATYDRLKAASATPGAISGQELTTSEQGVAEARAAVTSAEAAHSAARASVEAVNKLRQYLNLRAPFDGVVTERYEHPGALAGPNTRPMLKLEQVGRLRLVVSVPEAYYSGAARGQRIPFRVAAYPGREFSGSVARLASSMDPKTRTMPVELDVSNPRRELAPGMYADVAWPVRTGKSSLLVPMTAVATTTERTFVIRVNNGRAEWVDVRKGARFENDVEVIGNLRAGDTVVLRATDEIRDGAAVTPKSK